MKKCIFIGVLVFAFLVMTASQGYASYSLSDNITYYHGYNALSLTDISLRLPEAEAFKSFSQKAQQKLIDLAARYGDSGNVDYNFELNNSEKLLQVDNDSMNSDNSQLKRISFTPIPDVKINANYDEEELDLQTMIKSNFNLNYKMNSKTMIRAGYGLSSRKGWNLDGNNLKPIKSDDEKQGTGDQEPNTGDEPENTGDSTNSDSRGEEAVFNNDVNQQSSFGISYQTSDNVTVSADYIHNKEFQGAEGKATILGVEYTEEEGKLKAQYQVNTSKDKKQTITGLELDLKDLATITASYKLLDPQYIKAKLNKESVWDFGLDISLSEVSTFSLGYQLIDNKIANEQLNEDLSAKESNINASFKINF
jgi:hypothetical protein